MLPLEETTSTGETGDEGTSGASGRVFYGSAVVHLEFPFCECYRLFHFEYAMSCGQGWIMIRASSGPLDAR